MDHILNEKTDSLRLSLDHDDVSHHWMKRIRTSIMVFRLKWIMRTACRNAIYYQSDL